MIIDDTTGLPQLEEGYFWRVTKDEYLAIEVQLCRRYTTVTPANSTTARRWWVGSKTDTYVPEKTEEVVAVIDSSKLVEYCWPTDEARAESAGWSRGFMGRYKRYLPVSAESVLLVATEMAKDREEKLRRQTTVDMLLGDYPPKTLKEIV